MGIPAYFSYIVKNHVQILLSLSQVKSTTNFEHLYMDCNSVIYDAYHELSKDCSNPSYDDIIDKTIQGIQSIVEVISPSKTVFIAFDGVAPFAKMKQQKTRRFRSIFDTKSIETSQSTKFNTTMITPGTQFMQRLTERIREIIPLQPLINGKNPTYIITASDEPGEGEHKMMQHMRDHPNSTDTVAIYGLDSDLIMLAIYHLHLFKNLYVFREAQEFFKSRIPIQFQYPNEPYFMDMSAFVRSIVSEMVGCRVSPPLPNTSIHSDAQIAYDYVFLCFLLGNDFLPHFPTINLRTHGIQRVLDTYRNLPEKSRKMICIDDITNPYIHWDLFSNLIHKLASNEHEFLTQEYDHRDKQSRRFFSETTPEDRESALSSSPIQFRAEEQYIAPRINGWETRYYKTLFHVKQPNNTYIQSICTNYMEGLEWVFHYYTTGCIDWQWAYQYDYPPLLCDLYQYLPHPCTKNKPFRMIQECRKPCTSKEQLMFVLPSKSKFIEGLIDQETYEKESEMERRNVHLQWAFCKYLWESHVLF
jgi:5'-3' exoribonuclease 1